MMIKIVVSEQRCSNSHSSIECKRLPEVVHATSDAEEHVASSVYRNGSTDPTDKVASAEESLPCEPSPSPAPSNAGELPASNSDTSPICAGNLLDKNYAELLEACCNHDIRNATRILDQSSPEQSPELIRQLVLARDDFRDSALHLASSHAEPEIVRLLLARGADVNAENNLGSTPLNLAAVAGSEQVCTREDVTKGGALENRCLYIHRDTNLDLVIPIDIVVHEFHLRYSNGLRIGVFQMCVT